MYEPDYVGPRPLDIPRRRNSFTRVGLRMFKGMLRLDFRVWQEGGKLATREGVSLPAASLPELIEFLSELQNAVINGRFETYDETKAAYRQGRQSPQGNSSC